MEVSWKLRGSVLFSHQSVIANMQRPPPNMEGSLMGPALNTRLEKRRRVGSMFDSLLDNLSQGNNPGPGGPLDSSEIEPYLRYMTHPLEKGWMHLILVNKRLFGIVTGIRRKFADFIYNHAAAPYLNPTLSYYDAPQSNGVLNPHMSHLFSRLTPERQWRFAREQGNREGGRPYVSEELERRIVGRQPRVF